MLHQDDVSVETGEMSKGVKGVRMVAEGVEAMVMAVVIMVVTVVVAVVVVVSIEGAVCVKTGHIREIKMLITT